MHWAGKSHVNADALFHLSTSDSEKLNQLLTSSVSFFNLSIHFFTEDITLNSSFAIFTSEMNIIVQVYSVNLLQMHLDLQWSIQQKIKHDSYFCAVYCKIIQCIKQGITNSHQYHGFHWDENQQLLYYIWDENPHLCILWKLQTAVLRQAHDHEGHDGIIRTYFHLC